MSTDNITIPGDGDDQPYTAAELAADLGRFGARARRRASEVSDAVRGIDTQRENARVGARVVERKLLDDRERFVEEARQLNWILRGAPSNNDDAVIVEPMPTRVEEEEDEGDFFVPPTPAAPPAPTPPTPTPTPPAPEPAPPVEDGDEEVVIIHRHWHTIRTWSGAQWLLALVGLLVGLLVASATWDSLVDNISGFGRGLISTIWWFALMGTGFYLGGFIGSFFDRQVEEE